jgi:UDP-N-acetylglucosamine--N-acetylmuramyl-(pentapeptide) pyrophosphoryl-undecaprenol N-acetylglucosamine transferase
VPALALADVLSGRGHQVAFCGTERGMEKHLVPKAGYDLSTVRIRGFERRLGVSTLQTLAYIPLAAMDAYRVLRDTRPECVVGVGSHASGPVVAEAALRGIPAVAVEMDSHMGWTNTILSKLVDRVCLSYPDERQKGSKFVYTGRPLRPSLLSATREQGLARFGLATDRPVLLVFGGSLGAHALNVAVLEAFAKRETSFQVVHVTGELDHAWVTETLAQPGANPSYQAHAFLDDLALALAAADAVVARAGGSVAEVLARGVPALLVPYPYAAGDHQAKNARRIAEAGAALVVANAELDKTRVSEAVEELLRPEVNMRMRQAALSLAVPDAADRIADVVVELLARHAG